jgi:hypothetical protein
MNGGFSRAVQNRNHEARGLPAALKRASAILLASLALSGCSPDPLPPDTSARESFARTVMSAAASGSVEQVETLVMEDRINVRPEAERLVQFAQGWNPGIRKNRAQQRFPRSRGRLGVEVGTRAHEDVHDHMEQGALGLGDGRSCPSSGWWGKRRAEPGPRCGTH